MPFILGCKTFYPVQVKDRESFEVAKAVVMDLTNAVIKPKGSSPQSGGEVVGARLRNLQGREAAITVYLAADRIEGSKVGSFKGELTAYHDGVPVFVQAAAEQKLISRDREKELAEQARQVQKALAVIFANLEAYDQKVLEEKIRRIRRLVATAGDAFLALDKTVIQKLNESTNKPGAMLGQIEAKRTLWITAATDWLEAIDSGLQNMSGGFHVELFDSDPLRKALRGIFRNDDVNPWVDFALTLAMNTVASFVPPGQPNPDTERILAAIQEEFHKIVLKYKGQPEEDTPPRRGPDRRGPV